MVARWSKFVVRAMLKLMVTVVNIRDVALLVAMSAACLAALACEADQSVNPTAALERSDHLDTPSPTSVSAPDQNRLSSPIAATPTVQSNIETPTPFTSAAETTPTATNPSGFVPPAIHSPESTPLPTPAPPPSATPTLPEHHYWTTEDALAAAERLGCSGTKFTTINGSNYIRACASDDAFRVHALGQRTNLNGRSCDLPGDETARFTHAPTDLSQIASIVPAGSPSGGVIKPHSYLHNKDQIGDDHLNVRVPVYAVADAILTSVAFYGTTLDTAEYLIFFDVTCEISYKFDHLSELAPKLADVSPQIPANTSHGNETPPIEVKAGELIGYSVGAGGRGAWDFGAYDLTHRNNFANQERYEFAKQSLHTVCPYDYFDEPLKSEMYALFGTHDQRLLPDVFCTTTERDVLGAAAGAWFSSIDLAFADSNLAIAMLPGDTVAITGIGRDLRIDHDEPTWLDPVELTTTHCYAGDGRWFFIEISSDGMSIEIAEGSGACPTSMPENTTTYFR